MNKPFDHEERMMDREECRPNLCVLDPGRGDPAYWERLRATVMAGAAFELARRRESARTSVVAVLSSWSRKLIPATLVAAAAAALLVFAETPIDETASPPLALEDILEGASGNGPSWAAENAASSAVAFMTFVEGHGR